MEAGNRKQETGRSAAKIPPPAGGGKAGSRAGRSIPKIPPHTGGGRAKRWARLKRLVKKVPAACTFGGLMADPVIRYYLKKLLQFKAPKSKIEYQTIEIQLKKALISAFNSIFGAITATMYIHIDFRHLKWRRHMCCIHSHIWLLYRNLYLPHDINYLPFS